MINDLDSAMDQARQAAAPGSTEKLIERMVEQVGGKAGVKAVFGEPIERDGITVIPVAKVRWGVGGGAGIGPAGMGRNAGWKTGKDAGKDAADPTRQATGETAEGAATSSGSGAGGGVMADPVGYLEIGPDGASFRPVSRTPSPGFLIATGVMMAFLLSGLARIIRR